MNRHAGSPCPHSDYERVVLIRTLGAINQQIAAMAAGRDQRARVRRASAESGSRGPAQVVHGRPPEFVTAQRAATLDTIGPDDTTQWEVEERHSFECSSDDGHNYRHMRHAGVGHREHSDCHQSQRTEQHDRNAVPRREEGHRARA